MKLFGIVLIIAAAVCLAVPAQAQEKATDVGGLWKLTIETPMGSIVSDLTIKLDGENFTAELVSERGSLALVGTVDKEAIKFSGETNGFVLTFTGKPNPLEMAGTVDFGGNGSATWSAARP